MMVSALPRYLTYCTNVHTAETWAEVRRMLTHEVAEVAGRVSELRPFGVGLRLSDRTTRELEHGVSRRELRALIDQHGYEVYTLNGFPYGEFSRGPIKTNVYRPDWSAPTRVDYTLRLARLLAELLPASHSYGSVSTVPGGFSRDSALQVDRVALSLVRTAVELARLEDETGRRIVVALEPEPLCLLATSHDTVRFFEDQLWASTTTAAVATQIGLPASVVSAATRRHVGVCFDVCHAAVEFELPCEALRRLASAGIFVAKVQLSNALALTPNAESRALLHEFADDVFLHQVVARHVDGRLVHYLDLHEALDDDAAWAASAWRVHFHVPVFAERLGTLHTTRTELEAIFREPTLTATCEHFEIETYSWSMLEPRFRGASLADDIAQEIAWVHEAWR